MNRTKIREAAEGELFNYDIIIDNVSYPNNITNDLRLDRTVLEDEFAGQAALYAYYSTLAALAKDQEARLKRISELVYATSDHKAREEARQASAAGDDRKFTEKIYETMAKTNKEYQVAQLAYIDAKLLADRLTKIEHSFAQRKEMLISLGAHARVGSSDLRVLGTHVRGNLQQEREDAQIKEEIVETKPKEITKQRRRPRLNKE